MRALGVIPARFGATRFPGKPLAPLRGKPMIVHVAERAAACRELERVVVATDDTRIADAVRAAGFAAVMTRADHASGTDRVAEVAARAEFAAFDVIVNVQGDEPLVNPAAIAAALTPFAEASAGMSTLAHVEEDASLFASPHVVKVVRGEAGEALAFSRQPVSGALVAAPPGAFLRHVGLYAYTPRVLRELAASPPALAEQAEGLEQLRALARGITIHVVITPWRSRAVDTPDDLAALERDGGTLG